MPERLSEDVVRHVATLARLDISDTEVSLFAEQLSSIFDHFEDVNALDLDAVAPTTHALPLTNVLRKDVVTPSLDRDTVLSQAPAAEAGQFRVPRILGEGA